MRIFDPSVDRLTYVFGYKRAETAALRNRTYETVTIDDLRRFALWKLDRVLSVPDTVLAKLRALATQRSLTARSPEAVDALEALTTSQGVGYPMASTFLKFIRSDVFPIIDVRAYRALTGLKIRKHNYSTQLYLEYVDQLSQIARTQGLPLAAVDEQLYCFDKQHNGKIDA